MSLQIKDRIAAKERKSKILGGPEGIRENLYIEAYSARDRSRHDQGSLLRGKASYVSGGWSGIVQSQCGFVYTVRINE